MVIEKDKMVSLTYVLREGGSNGEIVEEVKSDSPLKFLYGAGQMLPHFESNIVNLSEGDRFEFLLDAEQAYGEKRDELIVDLPMSVFEVNGTVDHELIRIGNQVPMADGQGRRLIGTVVSLDESSVKMDFNHPMAGAGLFFSGEVLDVRDATDDELNEVNGGSCDCCGSNGDCSGTC